MLADVPIVLILVGVAAYTVLAGADFGAAFWILFGGDGRAGRAATRDHARHAMGPVWEANHVWLIFILVVCWTAYPIAFGSIMSTLPMPLFAATIGIILRGASYALRGQLDAVPERRLIERVFAFSSTITEVDMPTNDRGHGKVRVEEDALGHVEVPAERLWGAQTERSHRNFPIGVERYRWGRTRSRVSDSIPMRRVTPSRSERHVRSCRLPLIARRAKNGPPAAVARTCSRHRDIICWTRTLAEPGAMPQLPQDPMPQRDLRPRPADRRGARWLMDTDGGTRRIRTSGRASSTLE